MIAASTTSGRLVSLDQYRGYTVLGMFFVNFVGGFAVIPAIFKHHHSYCSYADTIMPQFFLAVGFAYRLTLLRRLKSAGPWSAYVHAVRRNFALILVGVVVYHLGGEVKTWADMERLTLGGFATQALKRHIFETLVHIGVTSLWVLPVIAAGAQIRILFACFSGLLHLLLSLWFNYAWVHADPVGIDGGPLGFLTWTIPLLAGSLAYDVVAGGRRTIAKAASLLGIGVVLMAVGYGLSCLYSQPALGPDVPDGLTVRLAEPPFVPPAVDADGKRLYPNTVWTMSQRAGSLSYLTFSAGFAVALYALFFLLCDRAGWRLGLFTTLGTNALAAYIIHGMVDDAIDHYKPGDSPLWYALGLFALYLAICWLFLRYLEKNKLYLKL
jgi:predicted acyltransferase